MDAHTGAMGCVVLILGVVLLGFSVIMQKNSSFVRPQRKERDQVEHYRLCSLFVWCFG